MNKWRKGVKINALELIEEPRYIRVDGKRYRKVKCKCDCGKEIDVHVTNLSRKHAKSCGCQNSIPVSERKGTLLDKHNKKTCSKCLKYLDKSMFNNFSQRPNGYDTKDSLSPNCKNCNREYALIKDFGITYKQYCDLLKKQNNKCLCCGIKQKDYNKNFSVDHCHKTNKIRGILCNRCNIGIGLFDDSVEILKNTYLYLKKHK